MTTIQLTDGGLGSDKMLVRCDLRDAASPVEISYDAGTTWQTTQYQCADARHRVQGLVDLAQGIVADSCGCEQCEPCRFFMIDG